MYEAIPGELVVDLIGKLITHCQQRGFSGVMVRRTRALQGHMSTALACNSPKYTLVLWAHAMAAARVALLNRLVRVGPWVLRQATGVPIGGLMSDVAANVLLGCSETTVGDLMLPSIRRVCNPRVAITRDRASPHGAIRYVDDLLRFSSSLCSVCLKGETKTRYHGTIEWDDQDPTVDGQVWCDLLLYVINDPPSLRVRVKPYEIQWVTGEAPYPDKHHIPPFFGVSHVNSESLTGLISGRLARFRQVKMCFQDLVACIANEAFIYVQAGYPAKLIHLLFRRVCGRGSERPAFDQAWKQICSCTCMEDRRRIILGPSWPSIADSENRGC